MKPKYITHNHENDPANIQITGMFRDRKDAESFVAKNGGYVKRSDGKMDRLMVSGSDYTVCKDDVTDELWEALEKCSHQGECDDDCEAFIQAFQIEFTGKETAADYLRPFGAWDESELQNEDENLLRFVWCLAGSHADDEDIDFKHLSTY
jgi:hypothetical protein